MQHHYDVVIIGSGLSGSLAADFFSRKGRRVCIVERGGDYAPDRRRHWFEQHIPVEGTNRWVTCAQKDPYERTEIKVSREKPAFKYNMKFGVGGSGAVWSGTAFRLHPNDFRIRSLYGVGDDWPITYDDLEPWYCMAEEELGVSGDGASLPGFHRSRPYPMPAFRASYMDKVFESYFGKELPLSRIPAAIASETYRGRGPCIGAGTCVFFCPAEARYHPLQNHLGEAIVRPNVTLLKRCMATWLNLNPDGDRIRSVTVMPEHQAPMEISGDIFVLAANTVENTRLLLMSANERFPDGLANRSGLLGKYLMSTGSNNWILTFPELVYPHRGRPIHSVAMKYADGPHRKHMASFHLEIWNHVWTLGTPEYHLRTLVQQGEWGMTLKNKMEEYLRTIIVGAPFEILPRATSTLSVDWNERDAFDLPLPVSHLEWGAYEEAAIEFVGRELRRIAPAVDVKHRSFGVNGNHPYGTYRMGINGKAGVVDSNLRSFDHDNLYVFGGGSFVTGSNLNPTLTIAALTYKSLHSIKI